jgi:YHS domain-containing protein
MKTIKILFTAVLTVVASACMAAEDKADTLPYPLTKCFISGKKLADKPVTFVQDDREIKLCCEGCKKEFEKDPKAALKKLVEAEKKGAKEHPFKGDKCPVSGEKLDAMGKPFVIVYADQEVKLCCKGCLKDFKKEPAKYLPSAKAAN